MSLEAHKLIGISLSKIAQSRASRFGISLHKKLLVATVLQKARYIFMEEAYQFVHGNKSTLNNEDNLKVDTIENQSNENEIIEPSEDVEQKNEESNELNIKYSNLPPSYEAHLELTYLNLDKKLEPPPYVTTDNVENNNLKRRHSDEEIVLPKKSKSFSDDLEKLESELELTSDKVTDDDFLYLSDTDFLVDRIHSVEKVKSPSVEIERLSSLVSIFSFSNNCVDNSSSSDLNSTDCCSTQAKDINHNESLPNYLAMTV